MTVSILVGYLRKIFTSLLPLPQNIIRTLIFLTPFIVLITAFLNIVFVVFEFIQRAPELTLQLASFYLESIKSAVFSIVLLFSVKPLRRRSIIGWQGLLALNSLFAILSILLFGLENLFVAMLVYYVLFQIEHGYN